MNYSESSYIEVHVLRPNPTEYQRGYFVRALIRISAITAIEETITRINDNGEFSAAMLLNGEVHQLRESYNKVRELIVDAERKHNAVKITIKPIPDRVTYDNTDDHVRQSDEQG